MILDVYYDSCWVYDEFVLILIVLHSCNVCRSQPPIIGTQRRLRLHVLIVSCIQCHVEQDNTVIMKKVLLYKLKQLTVQVRSTTLLDVGNNTVVITVVTREMQGIVGPA